MTTDETQGILCGVVADMVCLSENVMSEGMTFEEYILKLVVDEFRRRVVVALYLVADHLHLLVDLVLGISTVEDDIRQHIDSVHEVFFGDGCIEDGILLIRKGIQLATHAFEGIDDLQGMAALSTLEGHVLTEMGQSFFSRQFITRANS